MKNPTRLRTNTAENVVSSLLVPVQHTSLLVPNVVIAEVIGMAQLQAADNLPPWALGYVEWRGQQVPVLSFEIANSQVRGRDAPSARLAVFNASSGQSNHRFFALLVQGIPRMIKLTDEEVREDRQAVISQAEKMAVITQLGKASIPDMDYLESLLNRL